jgi:hypothetical protein
MKRIKCMSLGLLKLDASALVHVNNVEPSGVRAGACLFAEQFAEGLINMQRMKQIESERETHTHSAEPLMPPCSSAQL